MTTAEIEYVPISTTRREDRAERKSAAGRKTNAERARRQTEAEKAARRAKRIFADTPLVLGVLLGLVALMALASFTVSFSGLYAATEWAVGPDAPWLQVAAPFMLDIGIIAFTIALFVERERGESVKGTWVAVGALAGISAVCNILHTLSVSNATTVAQLVAGCVISGGAPVLLAVTTDKAGVKLFSELNA